MPLACMDERVYVCKNHLLLHGWYAASNALSLAVPITCMWSPEGCTQWNAALGLGGKRFPAPDVIGEVKLKFPLKIPLYCH